VSVTLVFRASSLADIPSLSESDWAKAVDPSRMMVTMGVTGLCISLTANGCIRAQHVLSQPCISCSRNFDHGTKYPKKMVKIAHSPRLTF